MASAARCPAAATRALRVRSRDAGARRLASLLVIVLIQGVVAISAWAACPPPKLSRTSLEALAADGWREPDAARRDALAVDLLDCLADPDSQLRDTLAFTGLMTWLRAGVVSGPTLRTLGERLQATLAAPDPDGFRAPFSALALAEVARVDRRQPFWTPAERRAVVDAGARYLRSVRDYRGFDPVQGWRHGVAHGADLLMQLALNPALERAELDQVLAAVAAQAVPESHFYVFGEGERLARPVIAVAQRNLHDAEWWSAWFGRIALAGRIEPGAPTTLAALARAHNARALLLPLAVALNDSGDAALKARLAPALSAALHTLW